MFQLGVETPAELVKRGSLAPPPVAEHDDLRQDGSHLQSQDWDHPSSEFLRCQVFQLLLLPLAVKPSMES